jgi:TonB-dependent receptor
MNRFPSGGFPRPKRLSHAVSLALASLIAGNLALAQEVTAPQEASKTDATAKEKEMATVIVTARRVQQSSIQRKRDAATAMDSIVADDVGSLPDRNIGEAISRMAGVAVDRGDFGEGVNVGVRGNGPELTRVELDGQAVQSAGGTDMNGGGDGRGTEFRQLSADLIKSVDVVKGSTADMTEGSLGGGIIIQTRDSLDFKKPFVSLRVAGTQSSLNKKWEPDTNLILSRKFLDDRLGVMLNASAITLNNEAHQFNLSQSSKVGPFRLLDFDNSPEKTFTYQPSTVDLDNAASTTSLLQSPLKAGGFYNAATPYEIVGKSADAQSKQDCLNTFPAIPTATLNLMTSSSVRNSAQNQRTNELLSCLNQWNDYTPSLLRYVVKRQVDQRKNLDLRTDFKVNRDLTVFAKGSYSKRQVDDNTINYGLGDASTGSGPYTYAGNYQRPASGQAPVAGVLSNVDPGSVVVDATHHVTQFGISNGSVFTDQIHNAMETTTRYLQLGGKFRRGGLTMDFLVADSASDFDRGDKRTGLAYNYGPATLSVTPLGIWKYTFPTAYDFGNPANYGTLNPAASATQPQYTFNAPNLDFTPQIRETGEATAKFDLAYALPEAIPFFKRIKTGFNLRNQNSSSWGGGGYTVQTAQGTTPAITVPTMTYRGNYTGCANTAGSLASGGTPCAYGYTPNSPGALYGNTVLPLDQFRQLVGAALGQPATPTELFSGASGRPDGLIENWTQVDVDKVFALSGAPNVNLDCVKQCVGSDGKMYDQPVSKVAERTQAVYVSADFGLDHIPFTDRALPFGWELEGNLGYRYIRTTVHGTGSTKFTTIQKTDKFDPLNPGAADGTVTSTVTRNTAIDAVTHDFLPIYNLALWIVPDKVVVRYNHARTVARPPVSRLIATGECTYSQVVAEDPNDELNQSCKTMGNPALKAQANINQNLSVEWYPNKDTMFTVSAYEQKGIVGPFMTAPVVGVPLFAGTNFVDPVSGAPLSDVKFDYNTYVNGPPLTRKGVEFSSKTAFTFLPWRLRYTGLDANYTRQRSINTTRSAQDLLSGLDLPPLNEPKYSYNWALWYDDGTWSARVAVQAVATKFFCNAACGSNVVNNYPFINGTARAPVYNPGSPDWTDATRFIDGKIAYKFSKNLDFFVEGRNLGNNTQTSSQPSLRFADGTPSLLAYGYAGRRITIGLNYRNL